LLPPPQKGKEDVKMETFAEGEAKEVEEGKWEEGQVEEREDKTRSKDPNLPFDPRRQNTATDSGEIKEEVASPTLAHAGTSMLTPSSAGTASANVAANSNGNQDKNDDGEKQKLSRRAKKRRQVDMRGVHWLGDKVRHPVFLPIYERIN
jgi:hypothetical protein